jgi:hypothetical protein
MRSSDLSILSMAGILDGRCKVSQSAGPTTCLRVPLLRNHSIYRAQGSMKA